MLFWSVKPLAALICSGSVPPMVTELVDAVPEPVKFKLFTAKAWPSVVLRFVVPAALAVKKMLFVAPGRATLVPEVKAFTKLVVAGEMAAFHARIHAAVPEDIAAGAPPVTTNCSAVVVAFK